MLAVKLKPGERLVVNGAVLHNGNARNVLYFANRASILRERDVMQVEQAVMTLVQSLVPPRDRGTRWSRVRHSRCRNSLGARPQNWQRCRPARTGTCWSPAGGTAGERART